MKTLDSAKLYYRRIDVMDILTLLLIVGLMFFSRGFLLSILLIVVYPFSHSKVLVSNVNDSKTKFWVRNMDWTKYRKEHKIGHLAQFRSYNKNNLKNHLA